MELLDLQMSALSRINFCFYEIKKHPPLQLISEIIDLNSVEKTNDNFSKLNDWHKVLYSRGLFNYLNKESTTEARTMLIINYLFALLVKAKNNNISIHINFKNNIKEIEQFEKDNTQIIEKIKNARDKFYAHIDLDFENYAKEISFDEIEICVNFLNKLFDYHFDTISANLHS